MTTRDVRPPDLEMQVRTLCESGRTRLSYTLHSPTGAISFSHREIAGPTLQGSPEEFQRRLLHKIEQLGERQDVDGSGLLRAEIDRKLKSLGWDLWRELFPAEIHHAYREIRQRVHSWTIVSDEPWIPWELIKPYDDSGPEEIDDDFLALRFELTRWLAGVKTPAHHIAVRSLAVFRTADLPHAEQERDVLMKIVRSRPALRDATPRAGSAGRLLGFLETGDADLLHFIGHGTHAPAEADESGIPFPDRSVLRPVDLEGPPATRVGRLRPLVFQNSCWAGQQGWSLTLLGGWAARWVSVCGCGAFVAPMWPSRDKAALSFARTFYTALERGATLGQAALAARRQVAHERPGDPSALAYTVYGHPNARLWFGEDPPETDLSPAREIPPVLPERLEPERQPGAAFQPRRVWIAAAVALVVVLASISGGFPKLSNPMGSQSMAFSPVEKAGPAEPAKEPAAEPVRGTQPKRSQETSRAGSVPAVEKAPPTGIAFRVTGGSSLVNYALKKALEREAKTLAEEGISGWIIILKLDPPSMSSNDETGVPLVACRLTVEASARGPGSSIDLGPVSTINSQTEGSLACEAATGPLAKDVLNRFVETLGTKGEP